MSGLDDIPQSIGLTDSDLQTAYLASCIGAGVSIAMALYVLLAAAWVYRCPGARHTLDRISFRLMLWTMGFEIVYGVAFLGVRVERFCH